MNANLPPMHSNVKGMMIGMPGGGSIKASPGRRYFYVSEYLDNFFDRIREGILVGLPLVTAFFSLRWASFIVAVECVSYVIGVVSREFDMWWNQRGNYAEESDLKIAGPSTELETLLNRLQYFTSKYGISPGDMYLYLDANVIPFNNNLDWVEIVSLLNQLSLWIGKHFEEEKQEGKEL